MEKCEECESHERKIRCQECDQLLCEICDASIHNKGKRQKHTRQAITSKEIIQVYWDFRNNPTNDLVSSVKILTEQCNKLGGAPNVLCYSDFQVGNLQQVTLQSNLESIQSILVDVLINKGSKKIIIFSSQGENLKPQLQQFIQHSDSKIYILKNLNSSLIEIETPPVVKPKYHSTEAQELIASKSQSVKTFYPQSQALKQCGIEELMAFQKKMFEFASKGEVMIEIIKFYEFYSKQKLDEIIKKAESAKLIHITKRQFGSSRVLQFISLLLDYISLESLVWVLRSLKLDEMTPYERSIQSRVKEAFGLKVQAQEWEQLMFAVKNTQDDINHAKYRFVVDEVPDSATGNLMLVIYPEGEQWQGWEQKNVKGDPDWNLFLQCLENYFTGNLEEFWASCSQGQQQISKKKVWSSSVESSAARHERKRSRGSVDCEYARAVPGGRYGVAQFVKQCGPEILRNASLGKLSQMSQQGLNDDILKYHRTLIMWNSDKNAGPNNSEKEEIQQKIQKVKKAILEILIENKVGVSLAQFPQYLKQKLDFKLDLTELGYPKLKDLISSIPQIQIELRAQNHPFAVIGKTELDEIINTLKELMQEKPEGIVASRVQAMLQNKLGRSIDFKDFGCNDIQDFVTKTGVAEWKYCEPNYTGPVISLDYIYIKPKVSAHTRSKSSGNVKYMLKANAKPFIPEFQPKVKKYSEFPTDFLNQVNAD